MSYIINDDFRSRCDALINHYVFSNSVHQSVALHALLVLHSSFLKQQAPLTASGDRVISQLLQDVASLEIEHQKALDDTTSVAITQDVYLHLLLINRMNVDGLVFNFPFSGEALLRRAPKQAPVIKSENVIGSKNQPGPMTLAIEKLLDTNSVRYSSWCKFKSVITENVHLEYFSDVGSERAAQYQKFTQQLWELFKELTAQKLDTGLFFDMLEELAQVCYTGWGERVQLLSTYVYGSDFGDNFFSVGHTIGRDQRREFLNKTLRKVLEDLDISAYCNNVHFQRAAKQWMNVRFGLGYSTEELGAKEVALDYFQGREITYNYVEEGNELLQALKAHYNHLPETERDNLLAPLLDLCAKEMVHNTALQLSSPNEIKALFAQLEEIYKQGSVDNYWEQIQD